MSADRDAGRPLANGALRDRMGAVIRQARKAQKLTLRDLAAICEVDYTTLSRIENGRIDPPARTIKAITEALGKHMAGAA